MGTRADSLVSEELRVKGFDFIVTGVRAIIGLE